MPLPCSAQKRRRSRHARASPQLTKSARPRPRTALLTDTRGSSSPPLPRHAAAPWTPAPPPGVAFCDLVLQHFYDLAIPASRSAPACAASTFWIRTAPGSAAASPVQVRNTLNFCFSVPHFRFGVTLLGRNVFSSQAANQNLAAFIVTRGRCSVGSTSLLLYPTLASAMAAGERAPLPDLKREGDVSSKIQTSHFSGWAAPTQPSFEQAVAAGSDPPQPPAGLRLQSSGPPNHQTVHTPLAIDAASRPHDILEPQSPSDSPHYQMSGGQGSPAGLSTGRASIMAGEELAESLLAEREKKRESVASVSPDGCLKRAHTQALHFYWLLSCRFPPHWIRMLL